MRKKSRLQVDTFPFLAVLLCAMGSLILVLLIMDRRSKLAARQKAEAVAAQTSRQQNETHARAVALRKSEHELRVKSAKEAYSSKAAALRKRLDEEELKLDRQMREVQARLADAAKRLRNEESAVGKLSDRIREEESRLVKQKETLASVLSESKSVAESLVDADKAKAKLTADLSVLEKKLKDLQTSRAKDEEAYSILPYLGKRGENRRPLYLECSSTGLILHPQGQTVKCVGDVEQLRRDLEVQLALQKMHLTSQGVTQYKPYLFFIVRPSDGAIQLFNFAQTVARQMSVDYGYELVNAEWEFRFEPEEKVVAAKPFDSSREKPVARIGTPLVQGSSGSGFNAGGAEKGRTDGSGQATAATGGTNAGSGHRARSGASSVANAISNFGTGPESRLGQDGAHSGSGQEALTASSANPGDTGPNLAIESNANANSAQIQGANPGSHSGAGSESNLGSTKGPALESSTINATASGNTPPAEGASEALTQQKPLEPTTPVTIGLPPTQPGQDSRTPTASGQATNATTKAQGITKDGGCQGGSGGQCSNAGQANSASPPVSPTNSLGMPTTPAEQPRMDPLPPIRLTENAVRTIYIECRPDFVVLHPRHAPVESDSLLIETVRNPFYRQVYYLREKVKRQADPTGPAPMFRLHYLVHPGGERTLHMANSALAPLRLPSTQYKLQRDDNVARIVAEQ
jgi:hypothetical protein